MEQPDCLRLEKRFDVEGMKQDLQSLLELSDYPWRDKVYDPQRSGSVQYPWNTELPTAVSLLNRGGRWDDGSSAVAGVQPVTETPLLAHAPHMREVLDWFQCPKANVRLSGLRPQGLIDLHADPTESLEHGVCRFHIPIVTNDQVQNQIGDRLWKWGPGELWYADFTKPHRVENLGSQLRVHLLITALVNDWVLSLFPPEYLAGRDIRKYEPPARLPAAALRRFECGFELGGELGDTLLPALIPGVKAGGNSIPASVRLQNDELVLFIGGNPLFRLEPLDGSRLGFDGLPFARLVYRFEDAAAPRGLTLDLKFDKREFQAPLPLRS